MKIGSKVGIYKVNLVKSTAEGMTPFYNCVIFEKVYNKSRKSGGNWETAFYKATITDTSIELEPADFSLGKNEKDKFSFDNIANPDKSIIRVMDFIFEKHTLWKNGEQVKNSYKQPTTIDVFYITKIKDTKDVWHTINYQMKQYEEKLKDYKEIKAENTVLRKRNAKLEKLVDNLQTTAKEAKIQAKKATQKYGAAKRLNTIQGYQLEKTQQAVVESQKQLKEIKKMKKEDVIRNAETIDFSFDDL